MSVYNHNSKYKALLSAYYVKSVIYNQLHDEHFYKSEKWLKGGSTVTKGNLKNMMSNVRAFLQNILPQIVAVLLNFKAKLSGRFIKVYLQSGSNLDKLNASYFTDVSSLFASFQTKMLSSDISPDNLSCYGKVPKE